MKRWVYTLVATLFVIGGLVWLFGPGNGPDESVGERWMTPEERVAYQESKDDQPWLQSSTVEDVEPPIGGALDDIAEEQARIVTLSPSWQNDDATPAALTRLIQQANLDLEAGEMERVASLLAAEIGWRMSEDPMAMLESVRLTTAGQLAMLQSQRDRGGIDDATYRKLAASIEGELREATENPGAYFQEVQRRMRFESRATHGAISPRVFAGDSLDDLKLSVASNQQELRNWTAKYGTNYQFVQLFWAATDHGGEVNIFEAVAIRSPEDGSYFIHDVNSHRLRGVMVAKALNDFLQHPGDFRTPY